MFNRSTPLAMTVTRISMVDTEANVRMGLARLGLLVGSRK